MSNVRNGRGPEIQEDETLNSLPGLGEIITPRKYSAMTTEWGEVVYWKSLTRALELHQRVSKTLYNPPLTITRHDIKAESNKHSLPTTK